MFLLHKELVFANFDPTGAAVIGLPTEKLEYLLLALLAVVVVLALPAVGIVLVISMLITPAAAASLLMRSFPAAMIAGSLFGAASAIAGMYISFYFNLPSRARDGPGGHRLLHTGRRLEAAPGQVNPTTRFLNMGDYADHNADQPERFAALLIRRSWTGLS